MNQVHLVLQGKGGVGKSIIASMLTQKQLENGPVLCFDTDPVNATFAAYSYGAISLELLDGSKINERRFDNLMEQILENDSNIVIDNGASTFIPLTNYLVENNAIEMLTDAGKEIFVHTVVTGGQGMVDTLNGLNSLATQLSPSVKIIVWINEFFGPVEMDGKKFTEMKVYKNHKDRIFNTITLHKKTGDTFGKDLEVMLEQKLSFKEALEGPTFQVMAKQRLKMIKKEIFGQLEEAFS